VRAFAASAALNTQDKPSQADPETQTAVADYNAGNSGPALSEFHKAAEHGSRLAEFNYAMMLLNGEGAPANVDEGKKWLRKAADANMSHAQYVYGKMYDDGEFVGRDPAEAHRWFLKAAQQGHVQAELALANQFLDGRGTAARQSPGVHLVQEGCARRRHDGAVRGRLVLRARWRWRGQEPERGARLLCGGSGAGRSRGQAQVSATERAIARRARDEAAVAPSVAQAPGL
jgi:TPR repeat protein